MNNHENTTKQAYIQLLSDTLEKKKKILILLMNVTEQQEELVSLENFDDNLFNETMSIKEEHLKTLLKLDEGFEKVFEGVKDELSTNKNKYELEIKILQGLIKDVTDLSVKLKVLEQRNRTKLEFILKSKRKKIKDTRISSKNVANYYRAMFQQTDSQSIFYDKKN